MGDDKSRINSARGEVIRSMMVFFSDFFQLGDIHQPCEIVEVKHALVLAVLAEERHVLAEIHVL